MRYVLGAAHCGAGTRGHMFPLPWLEPPAAGGPWLLPVAWLALAIELDDKSLGRFPSLSAPHPRAGETGVPRQGRLVSVLGWMCLSQHAICHAHQKLHNPSAGCLFLENRAGRTSREWRSVFSSLCFVPSQPTTSLDLSSFSELLPHCLEPET